jgi:hypothetical protein
LSDPAYKIISLLRAKRFKAKLLPPDDEAVIAKKADKNNLIQESQH